MIGVTNAFVNGSSGSSGGSVENGIYIVDTNYKCYSPDTTTVDSPMAIAIVSDNCCFLMGCHYYSGIPWMSSSYTGYNTDISSVPTSTDSSTIATYYDGKTYTSDIYNYSSSIGITSTDYCAARRASQSHLDGTRAGYLGSAGEWQVIIDNYSAVQTALTNAGGFIIDWNDGTYYWTSCEYNGSDAWFARFASDVQDLYGNLKYYSYSYYCVVPFYKVDKSELTAA